MLVTYIQNLLYLYFTGINMFIQKEYDENDARAKHKVRELFSMHKVCKDFILTDPSNKYSVDFYVSKNGNHIANVEVEVKKSWKGMNFIYDDIQILPRKKKMWFDESINLGKPTMFIMFNADLTNHLVIKSATMVDIYTRCDTRHYGTEKTRNDEFYIANKNDVEFGFFYKE